MAARACILVALAVAASACGGGKQDASDGGADLAVNGSDDLGATPDLGVTLDLAVGEVADLSIPPDLAIAVVDDLSVPRDLVPPGPADFAFGINPDGAVACAPTGAQTTVRLVWNTITAPADRTQLGFDLNGDGRSDNQLGNIVAEWDRDNFDFQALANRAIANGASITLLRASSSDASFSDDVCAATDVLAGVPMPSPDFSGSGSFTVDAAVAAGHFFGPLASARFTSEPSPLDAEVPTVVRVPLTIFGLVPVDVFGARITWVRAPNGQITGGQLNGAVRRHEIDTQLIPGVTANLNELVTADLSSATSMQIRAYFDTGGQADPACGTTCRNPDGSCAKPGDNKQGQPQSRFDVDRHRLHRRAGDVLANGGTVPRSRARLV